VCTCRRRLAANNRRSLADQLLVLDCRDHEQCEIYAARDIALEDGIAHVPAPDGQALIRILFEIASSNDDPPGVASSTVTLNSNSRLAGAIIADRLNE
jgi:hypothetical protein